MYEVDEELNDPFLAWAVMVWLRDYGYWLHLFPSESRYSGFAACVGRFYSIYHGLWFTQVAHADTIQGAAFAAARQVRTIDEFWPWLEQWQNEQDSAEEVW
jgi:hypothetical protein